MERLAHSESGHGSQLIIDRGGQSRIARQARYNRMKVGHPSGFIEAFANLNNDFADALIDWQDNGHHHNPYVYGLDHATRGLELFHAARGAHQQGRWTDLHSQVRKAHARAIN